MPRVVVLTVRADRGVDVAEQRPASSTLPSQFPNVQVLDWDGLANECPGDCFYDDGIHLRPAGQQYYADQLVAADRPLSVGSTVGGRGYARLRSWP